MTTPGELPMRPGRTPRQWQLNAAHAAREMLRVHQSVVISAATGTGKGDLLSGLAVMAARKGSRVLVLAERNNLVHETPERIGLIGDTSVPCGIIRGARNEWLNPVVSASVQTLRGERLDALRRFKPKLVITDECHHALAPSYADIYKLLHEINPGWKHIGLSATPFRTGPGGTTLGIGEVFDAVAFEYPIQDAIEAGDLVPIRSFRVDSTVSLDNVRISKETNDYDESDLAKAVDCEGRNNLVVDKYIELCNGQPAGVFAVNIAHAHHLAEAFNARGIHAVAVSGATKGSAKILHDFKHGKFPVICSCDLIREGWDAPNVVGILKARPTKSLLVFMQMLGRGTRTSPETGKSECIFVDFVDNGCTFDLTTIANLNRDERQEQGRPLMIGDEVNRRHYLAWGIGVVLDTREVGPVTEFLVGWPWSEALPEGAQKWHPRKELSRVIAASEGGDAPEPVQARVIDVHTYEIQLFGSRSTDGKPPVGWYEYDGALIAGGAIGTPRKWYANNRWHQASSTLHLFCQASKGAWEVWSIRRDPPDAETGERVEVITREKTAMLNRAAAILWAQEHLRACNVRVVDHTAQWRGETITEKQAKALKSWGIRRDLTGMSRGEASVLMDAVICKRLILQAARRPVRAQPAITKNILP